MSSVGNSEKLLRSLRRSFGFGGFPKVSFPTTCPMAAATPPAEKSETHSQEWEACRWLRVLAFAVILFCTVGLQFSFASLLSIFEKAFSAEDRGGLATVGAVSLGVMDLTAGISGMLIGRLGERTACACGGVLAGAGLMLTSKASDLPGLIVTYGGEQKIPH